MGGGIPGLPGKAVAGVIWSRNEQNTLTNCVDGLLSNTVNLFKGVIGDHDVRS